MVWKIDANIVVLVTCDGWIFLFGLSNVLDEVEEGQVGPNGKSPRKESLGRRNILAIEIEGQFGSAGVVKQTIVVFHKLVFVPWDVGLQADRGRVASSFRSKPKKREST